MTETVSVEPKQLSRSLAYKSQVPALDSITRQPINSLEDDERRLDEIPIRAPEVAEIVPLNKSVATEAISYRKKYGLGCQNHLVFSPVIDHLPLERGAPTCYLNRNSKDFDDPDIVETLRKMGCKMLFSFDNRLDDVNGLLGS